MRLKHKGGICIKEVLKLMPDSYDKIEITLSNKKIPNVKFKKKTT